MLSVGAVRHGWRRAGLVQGRDRRSGRSSGSGGEGRIGQAPLSPKFPAPKFPALAFRRDVGRHAIAGRERLTWFCDDEDFSTCTSWKLRQGERLGMVLVDRDLRCWKVLGVVDLGVIRPFWERVLRLLARQSLHRIDQEVAEIEPMSLEQVKARILASIQANPDDWRDDEMIAGESGPPRDEQDLLDELADAVRAAASMPQIINALYGESLEI